MPSEIVDRFPGSQRDRRGIPVDFRNVPSPRSTSPNGASSSLLCDTAGRRSIPDLAGIVIGHGTATLEETA